MTRERKLREVLNVRLDEPLAREIRRIADVRGKSESEVARQLLSYGAEVERRLQMQELARHHAASEDTRLGNVIIEARWEPFPEDVLDEHGI
jgi:predicted transcriptional regulator